MPKLSEQKTPKDESWVSFWHDAVFAITASLVYEQAHPSSISYWVGGDIKYRLFITGDHIGIERLNLGGYGIWVDVEGEATQWDKSSLLCVQTFDRIDNLKERRRIDSDGREVVQKAGISRLPGRLRVLELPSPYVSESMRNGYWEDVLESGLRFFKASTGYDFLGNERKKRPPLEDALVEMSERN